MCRREEPDSGAGSDTARTAVEEGSVWHDDPRLQAPRHDHAICRFKFVGRQGDRAVPSPTPPSGVSEIPAAVGPGVSWGAETASGAGQLRHAQDTAGASLAENPSAVCAPLHSHQFELAEPGGAVVWGVNGESDPAQCFCQRPRIGAGHRNLSRRLECRPAAVCMDGQVGGHPP